MSQQTRYIELNSQYRNRVDYPLSTDFVVPISQAGDPVPVDPVCNSSPIYIYNWSFMENKSATSIGSLTVDLAGPPHLTGPLIFQINGIGLRQTDNFYNGCMLVNGTVARRIVKYTFLDPTNAIITLESALPDFLVGNANFYIPNSTPIATNTANSVIKVYIPGGFCSDNYYINYYLQLVNGSFIASQALLITAYDGTTRLATLSGPTTVDWLSSGDINFAIRKELPVQTASYPTDIHFPVSPDGRSYQLAVTASPVSNSYLYGCIRNIQFPPDSGNGFSVIVPPYNEERRIVKYFAGNGHFQVGQLAGDSVFTLAVGASTVNDYYTGGFLTAIGYGTTRLVTSYNGATRSGTVQFNWDSAFPANAEWAIRTVTLATPFSAPLDSETNGYEIEPFSYDNAVPFTYTGSLVSQQEVVCYEVNLLNLVIANTLLISGRGSRLVFYPYIYVELDQVSSTNGGTSGIIYSNNPNADKMTFRVIVNDTNTEVNSPFLKLDSDGMIQTIKFKPNTDFHIRITDPQGNLIQFSESDYYTPKEPNPVVQMSACFAFRTPKK